MGRRPVHSHIISRDSESREKGRRYCCEGAASLNAIEVLMLHSRLKIIQARAAQANKAALEAKKQRDELHTQIEEIEEQLQPT